MWEFIKYCLYCLGVVISGASGNNPDGMSIKNIIIGSVTMAALTGLGLGLLWLTVIIVNKLR